MQMEQNNELKVLSMRLTNLEAFVLVILERRKRVVKYVLPLMFHITIGGGGRLNHTNNVPVCEQY